MRQSRGMLAKNIQQKTQAFLHRTITVTELRLYSYIDYCVKNPAQCWGYTKLNTDERNVLDILMSEKYLIYSPDEIIITKEFYHFIQDILADSYVTKWL